eukprot:scaffold14102_cov128-Isochrysis_galbana.AAC.2
MAEQPPTQETRISTEDTCAARSAVVGSEVLPVRVEAPRGALRRGVRVGWGGQEADSQAAPDAAGTVHGKGVEWVVHPELEHQARGAMVHPRANAAAQDGAPRVDGGAGGGDGDEATEQRVACVAEIPDVAGATPCLWEEALQQQTCAGRSAARQSRRDCGTSHIAQVIAAVGVLGESRARFEAVPANPQQEHAEDGQRGGVAVELVRLVEPADAGPKDGGGDGGGDAASHVYDARARKVDHAAEHRLGVDGR